MSDNTELKTAIEYILNQGALEREFIEDADALDAAWAVYEALGPTDILALIADIEDARNGMKHSCAIRLKKRIELLETQRDQLIADNERLTKAVGLQVIRRFVGDDDQKNIDELVAAGIQVDKELIVQLKAENERLAAACERAEQIIIVECKAASLAKVRANLLEANRDQLRAEVVGLKTGYEAYERVNAELKAEVERLNKEREGKVLCDLELFETLRDSANTEADEHRQCMATYRPLRQASLDSVVKKCDELLAAMGQGEQS
ncbi:hypothetical protein [Pseudomonas sp.]|uniref:hypothetical protein n=1 Tax=Pseudomonas sp. TaxID=306 RepID=UPI0023539F6E|nr:hypothetical protein [Pseudomonas sp.]